jgi:hypothetical protein
VENSFHERQKTITRDSANRITHELLQLNRLLQSKRSRRSTSAQCNQRYRRLNVAIGTLTLVGFDAPIQTQLQLSHRQAETEPAFAKPLVTLLPPTCGVEVERTELPRRNGSRLKADNRPKIAATEVMTPLSPRTETPANGWGNALRSQAFPVHSPSLARYEMTSFSG